MPIENENPLVLPAEAEKTLSQIWVSSLSVNVPTASDGSLYLQLRPCDAATGEIADEEYSKGLHLSFWEVISEVPEAAAAMQSVFDAVPAIEAFYDAKMAPPEPAPEPEPPPPPPLIRADVMQELLKYQHASINRQRGHWVSLVKL